MTPDERQLIAKYFTPSLARAIILWLTCADSSEDIPNAECVVEDKEIRARSKNEGAPT